MESVELSICIVTWNSIGVIGALLDSLTAAIGETPHEILVTENASGDGIEAFLAARYPAVKVHVNDVNRYFTFATNQNLRRAQGRHVISINPDGVMMPGSVARMVDVLTSHPRVGAVTPRFVLQNGQDRVSFARFISRKWSLFEAVGINEIWPNNRINRQVLPAKLSYDPAVPRDVEVLYGACIGMRREVLEQVGYNDEKLIHGFDEYDFCRRIRDAGWTLRYEPSAVMMHIEGASRALVTDAARADLKRFHRDAISHIARTHFGTGFGLLYRLLFAVVRPIDLAGYALYRRVRSFGGRCFRKITGRTPPAPTSAVRELP